MPAPVKPQQQKKAVLPASGHSVLWILNSVIVVLVLVVGFFSYRFFNRVEEPPKPLPAASPSPAEVAAKPSHVVQLDVLNGCGAKGAGTKFTNYLRANGFDVVEMKNYKTFHVPETMVVDRIGNLQTARQVAKALGVADKNVIQQINPDYYVDVSVIIGKDYTNLKINP